jgi:2-phospho-L-lactate guanylyltransferase
MLGRTLAVAREITQPDRIFLVTADEDASARAAEFSIASILDRSSDLNCALDFGRKHIANRVGSSGALLILPIDLPFADELAIARALRSRSHVTIAADRDRLGTNLLLLRDDAIQNFTFQFGPGSFPRHRDAAVTAGYSVELIEDPALAFDIDEPDHFMKASLAPSFKKLVSV